VVQWGNNMARRRILSLLAGVLVVPLSWGLFLVPHLINRGNDATFNTYNTFTAFAGISLQGILAAALLAPTMPKVLRLVRPSAIAVLTFCNTTVLVVILPVTMFAPYHSRTDLLIPSYALLGGFSAALFVSTRLKGNGV
jgi:hypothetical protein